MAVPGSTPSMRATRTDMGWSVEWFVSRQAGITAVPISCRCAASIRAVRSYGGCVRSDDPLYRWPWNVSPAAQLADDEVPVLPAHPVIIVISTAAATSGLVRVAPILILRWLDRACLTHGRPIRCRGWCWRALWYANFPWCAASREDWGDFRLWGS